MFGTMGFSELIIILVIVLIIFGAGKLPQIGEGVGKALKGFKKEVNDIPVQEAAAEQRRQQHLPARGLRLQPGRVPREPGRDRGRSSEHERRRSPERSGRRGAVPRRAADVDDRMHRDAGG